MKFNYHVHMFTTVITCFVYIVLGFVCCLLFSSDIIACIDMYNVALFKLVRGLRLVDRG